MKQNELLERVKPVNLGWASILRTSLFVVPFALGASAFFGGAELSSVGTIDDLPTVIYYSLSLFVLGGVDLGVPIGGPIESQVLLWIAYFMAPISTVLTVIEGIMIAASRSNYALRLLNRHVVVVGCGKTTMLYLQRQQSLESRQGDPIQRRQTLIVESNSNHANLEEARRLYGARILIGDIRELTRCRESRRKLLGLHRAHRVFVATGDDFLNLDVATSITEHAPHLRGERTRALVADAELLDLVGRQLPSLEFERFETNRLAAEELVESQLLPHFKDSAGKDSVVLAGFGRFGSSLLYRLQETCSEELKTVLIIDHDACEHWERFRVHVQDETNVQDWHPSYDVEPINGDLQDVNTWNRIEEKLGGPVNDKVTFVIASGNDSVNMRSALSLKKHFPKGYVVTKVFESSPFAEKLSEDLGLHLVEVDSLILDSFCDEWFE